jgi:GxxExxY protein
MTEVYMKSESYAIVGAAMAVHSELGCGFPEAVYQEALEIELADRGIPFESQKRLRIAYKGHVLAKEFVADMVCYDKVIVEIKSARELTPVGESQLLNYLRASGLRLGLLINFGSRGRRQYERFVL